MEAYVEQLRNRGYTVGVGTRFFGVTDGVNPHLISIGEHCVIGVGAALLAHGPLGRSGRVVVGDFVWIAFGAALLPGVEIGHHSIIGTGAVVTRSVPAGSVVVGNPARLLRTLTWEEQSALEAELRSMGPIGYVDPTADESTLRSR